MQKIYLGLILLISLSLSSQKSLATHAAGGELIYKHISGNTYEFIFKFYRDCGAAGQLTSTEPATFTMCYTSPCVPNGVISSVTMPKVAGNIATNPAVPNGSPLNNGCDAITTCDDPNSTTHGYRQWWYSAQVTLPQPCNAWKFWVTLCCRNDITGNITLPPGSQYLYVEANFDNTTFNVDNSPEFQSSNAPNSLPVPYVCVNLPYTHIGGATDANADSLVFETIYPYTKTGCNANAPVNILLPAFNILNTAGEPLPCGNSYSLDQSTGQFSLTPNATGYFVLCQKVSQYRNGVLIGNVMRDMQMVVDVCNPLPVSSFLDSISVVGGDVVNGKVTTCPESNLYFCFEIVDNLNPTSHVVHLSDNHTTALPGSTITFSNPTTNRLRVCVQWVSNMADTNLTKTLSITVKDTLDCNSTSGVADIDVRILKRLYTGGDSTICKGDTISIWGLGNGALTWSMLPGGSPNSLSCTNCTNPMVYPYWLTKYEVTDDKCGFKDTVTVDVLDLIKPVASFELTPRQTTMVNPNFKMVNTSKNGISYAWYDFQKNLLSTSTDFNITEDSVGQYCYFLEATNFCGDKSLTVECAHILDDGFLVVPSAFTPNGDGKNDIFKPKMIGSIRINDYSFLIYDRWGNQLFKAKNFNDGWNGTYKGRDSQSDTYFYYVETFDALSKKLVYKGTFTLLR
jgi:gliding motility-associated-like protein